MQRLTTLWSRRERHMSQRECLRQGLRARLRPAGLMEFSRAMESWLTSTVADPGTHVDSGFGAGGRDLWVTVDGQEFLIRLSLVRDVSSAEESKV